MPAEARHNIRCPLKGRRHAEVSGDEASHTCLDCDGVAQASLVLVPCDLNVGPVLKTPRMVLRGLLGPQLLALERHCTSTLPVSLWAWS